jgi:hypothetical protein
MSTSVEKAWEETGRVFAIRSVGERASRMEEREGGGVTGYRLPVTV